MVNQNSTGFKTALVVVFLVGMTLHILLILRSWIGGDQILLLNLGLDFALGGIVHPFAKYTIGAGGNPGALLQLLIGIPLKIFPHFHSPMIVVFLFHLAAGWILFSFFLREFGHGAAFLFALVYWCSPWRLYNSGLLWEPAFIFLPAALHLWSSWRLRSGASFGASFVLGLLLVASLQIHNSVFLLFLLTLVLVIRKLIHVRWSGFLLGSCAGAFTLVPAFLAIVAGEVPLARESQGFFGMGLLKVYPVLKGFLYWFTLGSLDAVRALNETVLLEDGTGEIWIRFLQLLCILSVGIPIMASWWYFRPMWRGQDHQDANGQWLRLYAFWALACLVVSAALSPIVLQGWQVIVVLPATTIPVVIWGSQKWFRSTRRQFLLIGAYLAASIAIILTLAFGHPMFRIPESIPGDFRARLSQNILNIIPVN